jgi:hypothetical protein
VSDEKDRKPPQERERRELDAIFGDVLPDTTSDERDTEASHHRDDSWYQENRPPHHDR